MNNYEDIDLLKILKDYFFMHSYFASEAKEYCKAYEKMKKFLINMPFTRTKQETIDNLDKTFCSQMTDKYGYTYTVKSQEYQNIYDAANALVEVTSAYLSRREALLVIRVLERSIVNETPVSDGSITVKRNW